MKLEPTPEGDLRLHLDHLIEWMMARGVLHDAEGDGFDLAGLVGAGEEWDDWREWVAPDLREGFARHLGVVAAALQDGAGFTYPAVVPIARADFFDWYAAFNQARLALEATYHFGPTDDEDEPEDEPPGRNSAFHRSRFYGWFQSRLLDMGL